MAITVPLTIVALMNAMIGGTILILPLIFLQAGIIPSLVSCIIMGLVNQISCRICINHLGTDPDLPSTIDRHSNGVKLYSWIYNLLLFIGNMTVCILYFELIVIQWQTLVGSTSIIIPIVNGVVVTTFIFVLKYFKFGTKLLGYGIISIITYLLFLIWVAASEKKGVDKIPLWTWNFSDVFNALSTAFSIQGVFIPIMRKCEDRTSYKKIILLSFIFGGSVYAFIGFTGSFGIVNRRPYFPNPQTIEDYFSYREWPVMTIAAIYLVHLYSALPEYLMIGKKRFLNLFKIEEVEYFTWQETVVVLAVMAVCFVMGVLNVQLSILLAINGSLIAFFSTYLVPVYIHMRCYYMPHTVQSSVKLIELQNQQHNEIEGQVQIREVKERDTAGRETNGIGLGKSELSEPELSERAREDMSVSKTEVEVEDCIKTFNPWKIYLMLGVNIALILFGLFVLGYTVYTMVS